MTARDPFRTMPRREHPVLGTDLNCSESVENRHFAALSVSSLRREIEPTYRQHGDIVERERRADEAADRCGDGFHDRGSRSTRSIAQHRFQAGFREEFFA